MRCPSCDFDNIPGDDFCAHCGMDLAGLDIKAWGVGSDDPILNMPLSELRTKAAVAVEPGDTIAEMLRRVGESGEGCAFVVDGEGLLVGVITERDVVTRIVMRRRPPGKITVGEVMTEAPFALRLDDPLRFALTRMGVDGFRHVAIVDEEGRLTGFFSARTVLQALAERSQEAAPG